MADVLHLYSLVPIVEATNGTEDSDFLLTKSNKEGNGEGKGTCEGRRVKEQVGQAMERERQWKNGQREVEKDRWETLRLAKRKVGWG